MRGRESSRRLCRHTVLCNVILCSPSIELYEHPQLLGMEELDLGAASLPGGSCRAQSGHPLRAPEHPLGELLYSVRLRDLPARLCAAAESGCPEPRDPWRVGLQNLQTPEP